MTSKCKIWGIGKIAIPVFFIFFVSFIAGAVEVSAASTIIVSKTSPACTIGDIYCDTIQEAINRANNGDTIIVCPGIYRENIIVDKSVSILSYTCPFDTIIQAQDTDKSVFHVTANHVNIGGFRIKDGTRGIYLEDVICCNISNNNIILCYLDGIFLDSSFNNTIKNNIVTSNDQSGIGLYLSHNNTIERNIASKNCNNGIYLNYSSDNIVKNNTASTNEVGINLYLSFDNIIGENIASNNCGGSGFGGIILDLTGNNTIENNIALNNSFNGIYMSYSINNTIKNNTASNNRYGIYMSYSLNNTIKNNIAESNDEEGVGLYDSSDNTIEKNIASRNGYGIYMSSSFNNIIKNNIANSNNKHGIWLSSSDDNVIEKNIASNNYGGEIYAGIYMSSSFNNSIIENIANSNYDMGIWLSFSCNSILKNNNVSINGYGIYLGNSTENNIYHNNIINNTNQAFDDNPLRNNWHYYREGNYWSDYNGTDDGSGGGKHSIPGDGIGDTESTNPHPYNGYDNYPFVNKSRWLTFLVSPEYWDFGTVYQGRSKNVTFVIQNRGVHDLTILSISADPNIIISDIEPSMKITKDSSKTFNVTIDATNLEGDVLKSVEIMSDDKITPNKTILIYGFVKPPIHDVRITAIDFDSRVIKGQIDMFNVSLSNHGSYDEYSISVEFKDGTELLGNCTIPVLLAGENETVSYHWDTKDAASGVHEIAIEVRLPSKELLDGIKVKVNVLSSSEASTLIVTNFERMSELWGENETAMLEEKLIVLSYSPCVNGIIIKVEEDKNCADAYKLWKSDSLSPEKANTVARAIKQLIESELEEYRGVKYILLVGDDRVIPFYRIKDNSGDPTENSYGKVNKDSTVGSALHKNMFLTDNIYAADKPIKWRTAEVNIPELFIPNIPVSRLVETPEQISAVIEAFHRKEYVRPKKIFVTAYDFMWDTALYCSSTLEEKTKTKPETIVSRDRLGVTPDYFENVNESLLNTSNEVILIFQHAEHDLFSIPKYRARNVNITSKNISASHTDLNGSIVYSMSCHAGLNVPPNASTNDFDLVEAFAQKGVVAYIAPTGYGIGSYRIRAAHELLLSYFTDYLCDDIDVGTALTLAKQEYWATNYDFSYFDEQVLETTTLYGLPMAKITIPHNTTTHTESMMRIKSTLVEEPDALVIRPGHVLIRTQDGDYYITACEELLSWLNKPIQPKEIRIFHPTRTRVLRGAVMTSAEYQIDDPFKPVIEGYQKSDCTQKNASGEIENWFPARIFKLNSISYPERPAEARQYLVMVTGQYKGAIGRGAIGKERVYNELSFDLYYASPDDETEPPSINKVSHDWIDRNITMAVNASDESGIQRVVVTYTDINGTEGEWKSKDCQHGEGDLWTCSIPADEEIEFFVQAVDVYGNVAVDDNEGKYYLEKGEGSGE